MLFRSVEVLSEKKRRLVEDVVLELDVVGECVDRYDDLRVQNVQDV